MRKSNVPVSRLPSISGGVARAVRLHLRQRQIFRLEVRDSEILVTHIAEHGFDVEEEAGRE